MKTGLTSQSLLCDWWLDFCSHNLHKQMLKMDFCDFLIIVFIFGQDKYMYLKSVLSFLQLVVFQTFRAAPQEKTEQRSSVQWKKRWSTYLTHNSCVEIIKSAFDFVKVARLPQEVMSTKNFSFQNLPSLRILDYSHHSLPYGWLFFFQFRICNHVEF